MTKPTSAQDEEDLLASIEIEIDPSLIAEALAAVEGTDVLLDASSPTFSDDEEEEEFEFAPPPDLAELPPDDPEDERRLQVVRSAELEAALDRAEKELARVLEMRDSLDGQLRDVRKQHVEATADFERFRQRARKDNEEAERRGEERALRAMLEIFDNVERARVAGADQGDSSDPAPILAGLQMIVDQFRRQLQRVGFERIAVERGAAFDPEIHEAVAHVAEFDVPEGRVVEEIAAGFRLRGRLFRPARVTVAAPPFQGGK